MWRDASGQVKTDNRMYEPTRGNFTSSDPAMAGGNWYAYCGGDPVNRTDPTGLDWELFYQIEGEEPPLFTINNDGVSIGVRWRPQRRR